MQRLSKGEIQFYASEQKELGRHREFHRECLQGTYHAKADDESLLGDRAAQIEDIIKKRLRMPTRGKSQKLFTHYSLNIECPALAPTVQAGKGAGSRGGGGAFWSLVLVPAPPFWPEPAL